jgi:hypothetical protein
MFYSAVTGGFYDGGGDIPAGALVISADEHRSLLEGQALGMLIAANPEGYPILVEPPPRSPAFYEAVERGWRDAQLSATDGVVARHRDELEEAQETTLTSAQYSELQAYRRALRNWPEAGEFPLIDHRPPPPSWLAEQIQ